MQEGTPLQVTSNDAHDPRRACLPFPQISRNRRSSSDLALPLCCCRPAAAFGAPPASHTEASQRLVKRLREVIESDVGVIVLSHLITDNVAAALPKPRESPSGSTPCATPSARRRSTQRVKVLAHAGVVASATGTPLAAAPPREDECPQRRPATRHIRLKLAT